jgi:hypothetical protein
MGVGRGSRLHASALALVRLACALAATAAGVSTAYAQSEPEIPAECGSRGEFDAELKQRLGNDAPLGSVHVSITQGPNRFHLRVQIGSELRELDDASCTELFRASVVVALAMLMHDKEKPAPPLAAPPPPPASEYPLFSVGAGAGLSFGTLPKPVLALELESKLLWKYWGAGVDLRYYAPSEHVDQANKGVSLQALGAGVVGIFRPSRLWEARLGFAAQRLSGEGAGSIRQKQGDIAWAAGPTLGLSFVPVRQGPFWAGLGAEGQLNLARGRFQILHYSQDVANASGNIYTVPGLAGAAFVRLGLVW